MHSIAESHHDFQGWHDRWPLVEVYQWLSQDTYSTTYITYYIHSTYTLGMHALLVHMCSTLSKGWTRSMWQSSACISAIPAFLTFGLAGLEIAWNRCLAIYRVSGGSRSVSVFYLRHAISICLICSKPWMVQKRWHKLRFKLPGRICIFPSWKRWSENDPLEGIPKYGRLGCPSKEADFFGPRSLFLSLSLLLTFLWDTLAVMQASKHFGWITGLGSQ